ncbi:hypothetical protein [Streptomyces phaeochromogenes]|uniref:hypothetical protein n=1 Tax=Streptomyces phaeochromogenes TaxID=1923 RepID=UPI002DD9832D|nr:hypothetical protein [Streptomyces phaeochromogenes]WRZ31709.1 hypothetical protein OG931_30210 [Streptomyces phaeochromogenes]
MAENQNELLQKLAHVSINDLYAELAQTVSGGSPVGREARERAGRALMLGHFSRLRDGICGKYRLSQGDGATETVARDAAAILDTVVAVTGLALVPAATLSVLVVKYGLARLCLETVS